MFAHIKLLRPKQWLKNTFLLTPAFFSQIKLGQAEVFHLILGFIIFSLLSSAIYVLNDYLDREGDRAHSLKKNRPIASGAVPEHHALFMFPGLLIFCAIVTIYALPVNFGYCALVYFIINIAYCFYLKHQSLIDVFCISTGFMLRVSAGAALVDVPVGRWIFLCTGFVSLFLAFAKRRDDIMRSADTNSRRSLKGYNRQFLDVACAASITATLICYALYTADREVMDRLGSEDLYLTVPFVTAGVFRYLQIAFVDQRSGDPTHAVAGDRFILSMLLLWAGCFVYLIYL